MTVSYTHLDVYKRQVQKLVWCALGKNCIIGPYFFEQNGVTVTVTAERYIEMLNTFFVPELWRRRIAIRSVWFQQDGATSHTSRASMGVLHPLFPNRLISRFGDVAWPPRSPDLSMCDYFLWGYLKSRVYKRNPRTLDELKDSICDNIVQIDRCRLETVEANVRTCLQPVSYTHLLNIK